MFMLNNGETLKVTVSSGVSVDKTVNDISLLFEKADKALYQAKRLGRKSSCL